MTVEAERKKQESPSVIRSRAGRSDVKNTPDFYPR